MAFDGVIIPLLRWEGIHFYEYPAELNPDMNWVHRYITYPRKYAEWLEWINGFRQPLFSVVPQVHLIALPPPPPYIPNTVPDPWHHRAEAADQFEAAFRRNQWIRWQVRRLLMAIRSRICRRRIIGDTDVGTMEPIPAHLCVTVQDWGTRSVYQFHASTIHKHIVEALRYQSMALSLPKLPKNPYTNLPWSYGQLLVLYEQMTRRLWDVGRQFLDPAAQAFYIAKVSMPVFQAMYGPMLDVECARRYFCDPTGDYWEFMYTEAIEDMFTFLHPMQPQLLRTLLVDRSLPKPMLRQWDDLVIGFWCYDNLSRIVLPNMCSVYDIIAEARKVLEETEAHITERAAARPRRKKKRPS